MLKGKTVLLGVSGSIAAYKSANLARLLTKQHANVHVLMTENAANFITPITFETLTGNKCLTDTFDRNFEFAVEHVALAKQADLVVIAPASADVLGKMANGIADDMLTTTVMACTCKKLIAPAMNTNMYNNPAVQDNIEKLKRYGYEFIDPVVGMLANGDTGNGKMADEDTIMEYIMKELGRAKDMAGKKVLITAGPTREAFDDVRYITNHSSGKMGYALAREAVMRGAKVTLVTGPTDLKKPLFADITEITSAADMYREVTARADEQDIIVKAAAVADYRPMGKADGKIKKKEGNFTAELERTEDTLAYLGKHRRKGQFLCGFSMETENMIENSRAKLADKDLDMIVANDLKTHGAGFGTDTNEAVIITREDEISVPLCGKDELAKIIFDEILGRME